MTFVSNADRQAARDAHREALAPLHVGDHEYRLSTGEAKAAWATLKGARQALRDIGEVVPPLDPVVMSRIVEAHL